MPYLFFAVALLYSMVGFGGGSSYIALLALLEFPYEMIPKVALVCNLIVVTGGCYHFLKNGQFNWSLFWPFAVTSVPLAYLGGRIPISREVFLLLLALCLLAAGLRLVFIRRTAQQGPRNVRVPTRKALALGGLLGLVSGMVGIGGGIFLAPTLLNLGWGRPKQVAAAASGFIFVNSVAGLLGQIVKTPEPSTLGSYWPLFLAVFLGGQLGSRLGAGRFPQLTVQRLTAALVLFVGGRILFEQILPWLH